MSRIWSIRLQITLVIALFVGSLATVMVTVYQMLLLPQLALAPDAVEYLQSQSWPGNVREMQNVLARAAILVRGRLILADDLRSNRPATTSAATESSGNHDMCLKDLLADTERRAIQHALEQTGWNRTQAARLLGISRRQLFDKIQNYSLQR